MQKVLIICGPTCVGKTDISIDLAIKLNGEIINGDSMQVYKHMDIGTAKIKKEEMRGIPHHLFDILELNQSFSISDYQKIVREKIKEISSRNKLPIIVGGSGLYLKSALYDYSFDEQNDVDYGFDKMTNEDLYNKLKEIDSISADSIHINNRKRIIRALTICYQSNKTKTEINNLQQHMPIFDTFYLGLTRNRENLYKLINKRVDQMINQGLVEEARYVLNNSSSSSTCLQAIGYKEFKPYFEGLGSLEEAIEKIKTNTRRYVKRQYTWFNHQMDVNWVNVDDKSKEDILIESLNLLKEWLL